MVIKGEKERKTEEAEKRERTKITKKVQTHKRFKRTLIYLDTNTQSANFRGNPLCQAQKKRRNYNNNNNKIEEEAEEEL